MQLDNPIVLIAFVFILFISFCIRKKAIRFLPFILFLVFIPFATAFDIAFIIIPVLILFVHTAYNDKYTIDSESLRDIRYLGTVTFTVMGVLTVFTNGLGVGYVLFAIISAISLSREVRHTNNTLNNPLYRFISFLFFIVSSGIAFFIVSDFFRGILRSIGYMIANMYRLLVGQITIPEYDNIAETIEESMDITGESMLENSVMQAGELVDPMHVNPVSIFAITWFVVAAVVLILVIIASIWATRRLFLAYGQVEEDKEIEREFIEVDYTKKHTKDKQKGYSSVIRKYYKRWVLFLIKKGLKFAKSNTSKDLAKYSFNELNRDARDLRKVYIKARYSETEITKQDAQEVKKIYKNLIDLS